VSGATITGRARFEKVAGVPSMGYVELFESDLFLSSANPGFVGPSRRLGSPPGQPPTYDGFYSIPNLPAGTYSVYVNQPDFFIAPKLMHDIALTANQTRTVNVDLDVAYSTYFAADQQWTPWQWDWTQTFRAAGTSMTGFSFRLAGTTEGKDAVITVRKDNGNVNPELWTSVASVRKSGVGSNTDNWVRFRSGQVPLEAGKNYAVQVHVDGGFAPYKRNKDILSYPYGRAYDENGQQRGYDLNYTVFVDKSDTVITMNKRGTGIGEIQDGNFTTRWGQTFVAQGSGLAAVDLFAAGTTWDLDFTWRVREGGPNGALVGPVKTTDAAYFTPGTGLHAVSYNLGEVPLMPGRTYYIEAFNGAGFNPNLLPQTDGYSGGLAYRDGAARLGVDLNMTILEYRAIPEAGGLTVPLGLVAWGGLRRRSRR
jgi:hypothetical protein